MHGSNGDIEFFVGGGSVPVIALQYYKNDDGFELWVPFAQTNRMDETIYALRDATNVAILDDPEKKRAYERQLREQKSSL